MIEENEISQIRKQVKKVLYRQIFAHHPDCDQYNHHVFKINGFKLCIGCTGVYTAFIITLLADLILSFQIFDPRSRILSGLIFFIPAIIQLFWKTDNKWIKFTMRYLLGISAYLLLTGSIMFEGTAIRYLLLLFFILGVFLYKRIQSSSQLMECRSCEYNQDFLTCKHRFEKILSIKGIEKIKNELDIEHNAAIVLHIINKE